MKQFRIEPIGAEFQDSDLRDVAVRFTEYSVHGFELHSVFQAQQPGCLGIGTPTTTYFAIYQRDIPAEELEAIQRTSSTFKPR